jgi:hypothetical protein
MADETSTCDRVETIRVDANACGAVRVPTAVR